MGRKKKKDNSQIKEKIDIFDTLITQIKDNKEIFISAIAILGGFITVCYYVYMQGYYSVFEIEDRWISTGGTSLYYKLVFPLCISIAVLLPNILTALPFIMNKELKIKIGYEVLFFIFSYLLIIYYHIEGNCWQLWLMVILGLFLLVFVLDTDKVKSDIALYSLTIIMLILYIVLFKKRFEFPDVIVWVRYLLYWFFLFGLSIIFAPLIASKKKSENDISGDVSDKDIVKEKNRIFKISLMSTIIVGVFMIISFRNDGLTQALNNKNYKIVLLDDIEYYRNITPQSTFTSSEYYDNLLSKSVDNKNELNKIITEIEGKYQDSPYVRVVENKEDGNLVLRRLVNAYVLLAEDGDESLVLNGYIDEDKKLYCFSSEKKVIDTKDVVINNFEFSEVVIRKK